VIKLGWYYVSKPQWSLDSLIHYPGAVMRFLRARRKHPHVCLYTTSYRPLILLYPFLPKKIVYHVHDNNGDSSRSRFFLKLVSGRVLKFIAVSDYIRRDLINCGVPAEKIEVVHNGIPVTEQPAAGSSDGFTIGVVGQVIPRKGHLVVVEALASLQRRGIPVKLSIVGRGSEAYIREVKEKIASLGLEARVEWRGFVEKQADIYAGIDVVVAPTRDNEAFGLMACEANAYCKPAIVSRNGGLPEIIVDGVNGFVVDPFSAEDIAEKIAQLYNNPALLSRMGENGRQRVIEHFSVERMHKQMSELITRL
jgi:glycosyltransferase involved in cell wall biosynthesis